MSVQIASYDVWDTVIRRRCHPDAVKVHIARMLALLLDGNIKPHLRDPWILFHFRQLAERSIGQDAQRAGWDDEYMIEDVFDKWIETVAADPASVPADLARRLVRSEIEYEKAIIYADPTIEAQFREDGATRRIFVSDFYMGRSHLFELLESAGVAHYFDDGYVSCDVRLNKRSGRLFDHVMGAEGATASTIRHWGDNAHSDVRMPADRGIDANHYLPQQEHAARVAREQRFHERDQVLGNLTRFESSVRGGVASIAERSASLFIGFMLYVQEEIVSQGLDRVYFFTREGEFFLEIYEALRAGSAYAARLPKGELLEVSRIATFGPSLAELSVDELMRLWNLYSTQSPRALLRTLDLPIDQFQSYFDTHGMELDEPIQYPWQDARMQALLSDQAFRAKAEAMLRERREIFLEYCAGKGLDSSVKRCAVVDIGWRGTIQDNIACMLPDTHFAGFYLGLNKLLNHQPVNTKKHAFGPDLNRQDSNASRELLEFVAPIEMLTNSSSGSVTGYERSGAEVVARKLVNQQENAVFESFTSAFQQRVLAVAHEHAYYLSVDAIGATDYRKAALAIWSDLIRRPNEDIARAYFSLVHNETFGLGRFVEKSRGLGAFWVLRWALFPSYRKQFRRRLSLLGWTSGYAAVNKDRFLMPILNTFYTK
ncbi:HAD family hydrolase [Burkholderia ubonensis]|uniref:HAD family hydrolase n=1 Tax=Burkholderia ubonensis TaxID=101571 RepID=UPI000ACC8C41|nr:HAD family hydrolase [Burkholderia ubonensis]